jgi:hypothetical protein
MDFQVEVRCVRFQNGTHRSVGDHPNDTEDILNSLKATLKQKEPMLGGLSLLFKDYKPQYWWWEVPKFVCTLILCGLVTLTNLRDGSQVFVAMFVLECPY